MTTTVDDRSQQSECPRGDQLLTTTVAHTVVVEGELDAHTAPQLLDAMTSLRPGHRHIDATGVSFAASAALGVLVRLRHEDPTGRLTITASPALRRIVRLGGLDDALTYV